MYHPLTHDDQPLDHIEWSCQPEVAAEARDVTYGFIAGLSPAPSPHTSQNLVLVVSELVTNALRHAGAVTSLQLRADRGSLQIVVNDPSPAPPLDRTPDLTGRSGGFGWPMVQRLAEQVSVRPRAGGGKAILAVLARRSA
ncbi:ATP-binding protein [Streptomyces sp. NPDC059896]|uniref:ATP-binding protein n=1 Tax=unclassified Streptomyces TaxID=2593676 RepID=UPI00364C4368